MRDYYLDFVSNHDEKAQIRPISEGAKGAEDSFVPFAPLFYSEYSENPATTDSDAEQSKNVPRNDIFEERIAIMMQDGGLDESDAIQYLIANLCDAPNLCE